MKITTINYASEANKNNNSIHPNYISGLTQADGSFFVKINIRESSEGAKALSFVPKFTLTQDLDSISCLETIKSFFNCGSISINESRNVAEYYCGNFEDIKNIIIPHFNNYPVYFDKLYAFNNLVKITDLLTDVRNKKTKNITEQELSDIYFNIVNLSISMNKASLRSVDRINKIYSKLNKAYEPELINNNKLNYYKNLNIKNDNLSSPLYPEFITGWLEGDGSFSISFNSNGEIKLACELCFDNSSLKLIEEIRKQINSFALSNNILDSDYKNIGTTLAHSSISRWIIKSIEQINKVLIPFIDSNMIFHTEKRNHYNVWREVAKILYNNPGLKGLKGKELFLYIVNLAYNMNKEGKRRKYTKEEYINLVLNTKYKDIN